MKNSGFAGAQGRSGAKNFDEVMDEDESKPGEQGVTGNLVLTTCFKLAVNADSRLTTGCDMLTDFFRGGFLSKKLYEIYGESGSGKT
mgnify:CR=1 FL=1